MELRMFFLLCGLAVIATRGSHSSYCVKSAPHSPDPCETLEFYASNVSEFFTDNTSFMFLPGTHVLSNISIHNVSNVALMASDEGNVTIQCNGSGGLVFQHASNVVLANLAFVSCGQPLPLSLQREGETAQAALAFGEVTDLLLESVSVSHSRGFGVLGHCVHGDFNITKSNFTSNKGSAHYLGGNSAIEYINCSSVAAPSTLQITSSAFRYGDYAGYDYTKLVYSATYATGLKLNTAYSNITVTIANTHMEKNINNHGYGGNLYVHAYSNGYRVSANSTVTILNSTFTNGTALTGAGVHVDFFTLMRCSKDAQQIFKLFLQNTQISHNTGIIGNGLYYRFQMDEPYANCPHVNLSLSNCIFSGNKLKFNVSTYTTINGSTLSGIGIAVHLEAKYYKNNAVQKMSNHNHSTRFTDCVFDTTKPSKDIGNSYTQLA